MSVIIRNVYEIPEERGNCGMRRRLINHEDCNVLGLSYLKIRDARAHFHRFSHEIYYVLNGQGVLWVNDKEIPLKKGATVLIPPLHTHKAIAIKNLEVLVIMASSAAELEDIEYID